jgi:gliding motility-associated-like protein
MYALAIFMALTCSAMGQLVVNTVVTVNDLTDAISGPGVIIQNAVLNCPTGAYGTFTSTGTNLGMPAGIILTTGDATLAAGANTNVGAGGGPCTSESDPDLIAMEPLATNDLCVLEFDIIPQCDTLSLDFVFGSEEYPEFVGGGFNDAFGLFISGPNPLGGNYVSQNIAIIPGTAIPVTIDNINVGSNPGYYVDNTGGTSLQYDGFTVMMTAVVPTVQCQTYHMKFAIADAGDCSYDSGVFLDFGGLTCPNNDVQVAALVDTAMEGCLDAAFVITRTDSTGTMNVTIGTGGTATNGADYNVNAGYTFGAGVGTMAINIPAIADGIIEGPETIQIIVGWLVCGVAVTDTVNLVIVDGPTIAFTIVDENCGACDGTAMANVAGGTAPITYQWDGAAGNQTTQTATGLCSGVYDVTIIDANGCTSTATATVASGGGPTITAVTVDEICLQDDDGTITATGAGGMAPLTYDIGGAPQGSGAFINLPPGIYDVTVTDANGCSAVVQVTLNAGPPCCSLLPTATFTDVVCNGACDGTATGNPVGANGIAYYVWFDGVGNPIGQTTAVATGLCPGTYTVEITDDDCTLPVTVIVTEPPVFTYTVTNTDVTCFGADDANITIVATGGTGPYQYSIDGGGTYLATGIFNGLGGGLNIFQVLDANGCAATGPPSATIIEHTQLIMTFATTNPSCFGFCDGTALAIANGGTVAGAHNYTYTIPGSLPDPNQSGVCDGTYTLTVTDDDGCFIDTTFTLVEPPMVVINSITTVDVLCANQCNGSITIDAPAATDFSIDNGATFQPTNVFLGLCPGMYDVFVQDANGCPTVSTATINAPPLLTMNLSQDTTICTGGTATLTAAMAGGTPGYLYGWDNGETTETIVVNPAVTTVYNIAVIDANTCPAIGVVVVSIASPLSITALSDQTVCPGESAQVSAIGQGGAGIHTYTWDDGAGNILIGQGITVFPTVTTTYTVTITDDCSSPAVTDQVTITVADAPVVTFVADDIEGCTPVTVSFINTTDPGMVGSMCIWDLGDGNFITDCNSVEDYVYTAPGTYDISLTVTSPNGCPTTTTAAQMITVYPYAIADFTFGPDPATILDPVIDFESTSENATSYLWTFGDHGIYGTSTEENPSVVFPDSVPGSYEVCLEASTPALCPDTECHLVTIDGVFSLWVPNAFTPDGNGVNDYFYASGVGFDNADFEMMIFNRWGELIFESHNADIPWDGSVNGGSTRVQTEVYAWKIVCRDEWTGDKKEFVGHVTLVR